MARHKVDYSKKYLQVISLGAGKQSSYMLIKALEGKFGIKPDIAVFADTGNEPDFVYSYLKWLQEYVWKRFKFKIAIVSSGDIIADTLNHVSGKTTWSPTPPFWFSTSGALRRQCTLHLKIRPVRKYVRKIAGDRPVKMWIGISLDEMERMKSSGVKYITNFYPLVKNRVTISEIKESYKKMGVPEPGKSSCVICPFHSDSYWQRIRKVEPHSFKMACDFDEKIRKFSSSHNEVFLHRSKVPLKNIDFNYTNSLYPELIEECEGLCGL